MDAAKAERNIQCEECKHTRENHDYRGCLVWINADASKPCPCTVVSIKLVLIKKEEAWMAKFVYANLETSEANDDAVAPTFYFEGYPTDEDVRKVCVDLQDKFDVSPDSEFFEWEEFTNPVADKAELTRIQVCS